MKRSELKTIVKEQLKTIKQEKKQYWVMVSLDSGKDYIGITVNNDKQAKDLEDKLKTISDITIFSIDVHGFDNIDKIKKTYNLSKIYKNKKSNKFIAEVYKQLMNLYNK